MTNAPDESMDDWYADGYAQERELARTAKYTVTVTVEYDPNEIIPIEEWDIPLLLGTDDENIAITSLRIDTA